jgi:uncharacterized membrane protein
MAVNLLHSMEILMVDLFYKLVISSNFLSFVDDCIEIGYEPLKVSRSTWINVIHNLLRILQDDFRKYSKPQWVNSFFSKSLMKTAKYLSIG